MNNRFSGITALLTLCTAVVLMPLLLVGCEKAIFTDGAECPSPNGSNKVRITTKILNPEGDTSLRAAGGYKDGDANPFKPVFEDANAFEKKITTIRVIGFYTKIEIEYVGSTLVVHDPGDVAFNKLFVDNNELRSLGRTAKLGATMLKQPEAGKDLVLEFETDKVGKFDVVLIANEPLNDISDLDTAVDKGFSEDDRCNKVIRQADRTIAGDDRNTLDKIPLSSLRDVKGLQYAMITTPQYMIQDPQLGKNDPKRFKASYVGALPAQGWLYSNGGIPMIGQGTFTINEPTASNPVAGDITVNMERMLAKIEINYSNTNEQGELYSKLLYPQKKGNHLHSIELNNYPRFATLLPAERQNGEKEFTTQGTTHKFYANVKDNRHLNFYYAREKKIDRYLWEGNDEWWDSFMPFVGNELEIVENDPNLEARFPVTMGLRYRPTYFLYGYKSPDNDPIYPLFKVDWLPYVRPNNIVKRDGTPSYYYLDGTSVVTKDYASFNDISPKPTVLYVLPTTNLVVPAVSGNGITNQNAKRGMVQEPTEVIVTTATYKGTGYEKGDTWTYDPEKDENLVAYRFRLFNNDAGNDKYAIRRNTIYRYSLVWEGKDEVVLYRANTKLLPWNVQELHYSY